MFERTRADLIARLEVLAPRFGQIGLRAVSRTDEARLAIKSSLGGSADLYLEIADKAFEKATLCRESITLLAIQKAWPLTFKRGVKRAEKFAQTCESLLNDADAGAAAGKAAFREKYGDVTNAKN
ncbi:hypothetical protein [Sphingomonas sp. BK036]|uniref:hypothetical protein n=1 Tax=Sphingomonas sp. BK036 TaxID=2512122 RepID=UPI001028F19B|nr:hypothetical protein [Sphingomonas sp. BK036]